MPIRHCSNDVLEDNIVSDLDAELIMMSINLPPTTFHIPLITYHAKLCLLSFLFEMNITSDKDFRAIADTTMLMPGCCKKFTADELYQVLKESM